MEIWNSHNWTPKIGFRWGSRPVNKLTKLGSFMGILQSSKSGFRHACKGAQKTWFRERSAEEQKTRFR
jgi:hypothetical protein